MTAESSDAGIAPLAVILDSGCGTGESTIHIARRFPNIPVIGIDKSCARLNKAGNPSQTSGEEVPANAFWIRAELLDFWRLALDRVKAGEWAIPYHAVYYPNPWPKQSEATRRFHMHPIFPTLLALGNTIELRTKNFMDPLPRFVRPRMTARMVIRPKWTKREVPACLDCVQHRLWRERQLSAKVSTQAPPKQPLNGNIKMPAKHSGG